MCRFALLKRLLGIARKLQGFQTHYPARGRKRVLRPSLLGLLPLGFKPITPQGDGNAILRSALAVPPIIVSNPLPRKGTETILSTAVRIAADMNSFKPITPQGDGNFQSIPLRCSCLSHKRFQTHYPARGRKHRAFQGGLAHSPRSFKPITPQGDGNAERSW